MRGSLRTPTRPRVAGLEAALVDNGQVVITALAEGDDRVCTAKVAGPAALLVAKLHKLGERQATPGRLVDKDAHDLYRLLVATRTDVLAATLRTLCDDALAGPATAQGLAYLEDLFARGPAATGSVMAGRAEEGVGDPASVAASVAVLARDLLDAIGSRPG